MSLPQFDKKEFDTYQPQLPYPPPVLPLLPPEERTGNPWPVIISLLVGIGLIIGRYYLPHQQQFTIINSNPPIKIDHENGDTWRLHNGIWETIEDDSRARLEKMRLRDAEEERLHPSQDPMELTHP